MIVSDALNIDTNIYPLELQIETDNYIKENKT